MGNTLLWGQLTVLLGFVPIFFPKIFWYIDIGWKLEDARTSRLYLMVIRILGGVAVLGGVYDLFLTF